MSRAEEAAEVVVLAQQLIGAPWQDGQGPERPLDPADILVVAAYNAHVTLVRAALDAAGLQRVRAGTVDKFQGQEAPICLVSMTASSADETARGMECGRVVTGPEEVELAPDAQPLKVIQRIANEHDMQRVEDNRKHEKEARVICKKKIREHKLPMKLVDVEYTFDLNKIIFYFTADGRIDFRDLVKDLASVFRTRIELRQIGVRDEAKMMGGIGCCGRPLCCATFLGDFEPVSIRMAKEQNLSLNPTKISGIFYGSAITLALSVVSAALVGVGVAARLRRAAAVAA